MAASGKRLTIRQILQWADAHRARTRTWPSLRVRNVHGVPGETWAEIEKCLQQGGRGLPGGSSLAILLATHRDRRLWRRIFPMQRLTIGRILASADAHHYLTGRWPTRKMGDVWGAPGEGWKQIDRALRKGQRGLPGGSSLTRLLVQMRGLNSIRFPPPLSVRKILAWADEHRRRTGRWPNKISGRIAAAPRETWATVDVALKTGLRSLPGDSSLAAVLAHHRGVLLRGYKQRLTQAKILAWADTHKRRTGAWPKQTSGPVLGVRGENWAAISQALAKGSRGLPGGSSLAKLLLERRNVPSQPYNPRLSLRKLLTWAKAHRRRTGRWPTKKSEPIRGMRGEAWRNVDNALRYGLRGLPGGSSLSRLIKKHRGGS